MAFLVKIRIIVICLLTLPFFSSPPISNPQATLGERVMFEEVVPTASGISWVHTNGHSPER
jgi:hypothetical protein